MSKEKKLGNGDVIWVKSYEAKVVETFEGIFNSEEYRFKDGARLIARFTTAIDGVLKNGRGKFRAVDEAHNELCIAADLLLNSNWKLTRLEYEPALEGCAKSIDFRGLTDEGVTVFIDVKTIKPMPKDRWDQFERALEEGWLPKNVQLMLSEDGLGGEIWHSMFAARSRMLEYTLELEQKIDDCNLQSENALFVLALCGEGFHWHQDELEDFVSFYFSGAHWPGDPFKLAEAKYIEERKITLTKTISQFACLRRSHGTIYPEQVIWNVQQPRYRTAR